MIVSKFNKHKLHGEKYFNIYAYQVFKFVFLENNKFWAKNLIFLFV